METDADEVTGSSTGLSDSPAAARHDAAAALLDGELAVGVWDRQGQVFVPVWVNVAFGRLTGYSLEQAAELGEGILGPGYRTVLSSLLNAQLPLTSPTYTSIPIRTRAGEYITVPIAVTVRRARSGKPMRLIVTQRQAATPADEAIPDHHSRQALEVVARISEILVDFDEPKALEAIARLLSRRLGVWCGFVVDDGVLQLTDDLNEHVRVNRPTKRGQTATDEHDPVGSLLARPTLRPATLELTDVYAPGSAAGQLIGLVKEQVGEDADGSLQALPLIGRGRTLGLLAVLMKQDYPGGEQERQTVLELCARRVGMALENAQLHHGEHTLVETLQRAMLPELDQIDALDVWTYYAPSSEHAQVGGDWYDVVRLSDDVIALVIGDVAGHDIEAAAAMGQLRSVVRAFAADAHDPGDVLSRVDRIVDSMRISRVASLIYATLTQVPGSLNWELRYSRAGHLPGLLVRDGQVRELDGAGGRLVGFGAVQRDTATEELHPGDVIVLYTDGLVERRDRPIQQGLAELGATLAAVEPRDAATVGESLLRALAESPEDDVAVVVMRVPLAAGGDEDRRRRRHWRFPATRESVRLARRAALATCRSWDVPAHSSVELVVSELVANAVLHGWGAVTLCLADTGEGVRIEVEDDNPMPPTLTDSHPARVGGYGMHIVSRLADWGWRPSGAGKVVWARIETGEVGTLGPGSARP